MTYRKAWDPDIDASLPASPANPAIDTPRYLQTSIVEARRGKPPAYGVTRMGYSARSGAPTSLMIRLRDEKRWRRLMVWQFSNAGTLFVRIKGIPHIVRETDIPDFK